MPFIFFFISGTFDFEDKLKKMKKVKFLEKG